MEATPNNSFGSMGVVCELASSFTFTASEAMEQRGERLIADLGFDDVAHRQLDSVTEAARHNFVPRSSASLNAINCEASRWNRKLELHDTSMVALSARDKIEYSVKCQIDESLADLIHKIVKARSVASHLQGTCQIKYKRDSRSLASVFLVRALRLSLVLSQLDNEELAQTWADAVCRSHTM
eukprot:2253838-Amphidinium_carterae.1